MEIQASEEGLKQKRQRPKVTDAAMKCLATPKVESHHVVLRNLLELPLFPNNRIDERGIQRQDFEIPTCHYHLGKLAILWGCGEPSPITSTGFPPPTGAESPRMWRWVVHIGISGTPAKQEPFSWSRPWLENIHLFTIGNPAKSLVFVNGLDVKKSNLNEIHISPIRLMP